MIVPRRRKRDTFLPWLQLAADVAAIQAVLRASYWLRFFNPYFVLPSGIPDYPIYLASFNFITLILVFFLRFYGLYKPARVFTYANEAARAVKAVVASVIVLMALTFFIRGFTYSRTFLVMTGILMALGLSAARFFLGVAVMSADRARGSFRNVLLMGYDENARKLIHFYRKHPRFSTRVVGILDEALPPGSEAEGVPVLGRISELPKYLQAHHQVHEAVLSGQGVPNETVLKMIYDCEKELVAFRWIADVFGLIASKMSVSYFGGVPLLSFMDSPLGDWENRFLKRAMDIALSAAALIIFSPVFLILTVLIKRDSPGPVFYPQERTGEDGRHFMLLKFRTMKADAEAQTGPVWASEDDPRRTRLGAFLRKNNLDELPQLWNVLKGDMSLVGPRPERPYFVSRFREDVPRYMARHSIRSGITGWAQVNGLRGNTSIEERTKFDLYYIENWSLLFDLKILFMTLFARDNAY
ncbi:MAG: undecaprenyl-phosphate glucose phosphotransferase [Candidatus Omnitrophica bacterium]|nr:undecaprenyl-phosphate glucose phosphotransferase [Candidatus Omnitrophota bacterium]